MRLLFCISILFLSIAGYTQVNLNSSLTACYQLNGNASDPVSSLQGTLANVTATVDRFNNANSAFAFSGSATSRIELPNSPLLKANQLSFACWVKFNTVAMGQFVVFAHNGCGSYFEGYSFGLANLGGGVVRIQAVKSSSACSAAGQAILNGSTAIVSNTWYHVGFYAGPDSLKVYVNGALDGTLLNTNPLAYNPVSLVYFGGSNLGVNLPLNGSIDNARFYNRKLNGAEFNQLYTLDPACIAIPSGSLPGVAYSVSTVSLCAGGTLALTDLSTNNPTAWNWQFPGASPPNSSVQNPTLSFSNPGTYTISMVCSNSVGASNTGTQSIVVLPNPIVSINASSNTVCIGQSINLYATGASNYTWSTSQTGSTLTVNPVSSTTYSLTGADLSGCLGNASYFVNALQPPAVVITTPTSAICMGQSLTLNANGASTYTWNNFQTGNSISVNPVVNTTYSVTGENGNACTGNAALTISVIALPNVLASANKTLVCAGSPVILSGSGAQTYIWNNAVNGPTMQVYPNFNTTYSLVGTNSSGCSNSAIINILVSACLGQLESIQSTEAKLAPNPASGISELSFMKEKSGDILLYNFSGELILHKTIQSELSVQLDLSDLPKGVYVLLFRSQEELIHNRLIKN
ncbi:MAG TPA: PKD domain-containing protein [Bacteroidia bacterium]|nr:PKD domain-containing protein [Bacteroidia bacterium]